MYPIVFIDGIRIKVRDSGVATNKVAHLVVGVDIDGYKHVLGIWLQAGGEGHARQELSRCPARPTD